MCRHGKVEQCRDAARETAQARSPVWGSRRTSPLANCRVNTRSIRTLQSVRAADAIEPLAANTTTLHRANHEADLSRSVRAGAGCRQVGRRTGQRSSIWRWLHHRQHRSIRSSMYRAFGMSEPRDRDSFVRHQLAKTPGVSNQLQPTHHDGTIFAPMTSLDQPYPRNAFSLGTDPITSAVVFRGPVLGNATAFGVGDIRSSNSPCTRPPPQGARSTPDRTIRRQSLYPQGTDQDITHTRQ